MRFARGMLAAVAAALAASGGGCGSKSAPATPAAVRGSVFFQGRPLAGGTIVFTPHPDRGPPGPPAFAIIEPNGEYRLTAEGSNFLPAGWYRIALAGPVEIDQAFPLALARPDRSGIEREVLPGKENVFEFAVDLGP
jgi:hypothetical protein